MMSTRRWWLLGSALLVGWLACSIGVLALVFGGPSESELEQDAKSIMPPGLWLEGTFEDGFAVFTSLNGPAGTNVVVPSHAARRARALAFPVVSRVESWGDVVAFRVVDRSSGTIIEYVVFNPKLNEVTVYDSIASGHEYLIGNGYVKQKEVRLRKWYN